MEVHTSLYDLKGADAVALSFSVSVTQKNETPAPGSSVSSARWVIIVLDNSGSMAGSGLTQAKQSIKEMVEKLLQDDPYMRFSVIEFNSYATTIYNKGSEKDRIFAVVDRINATGGTDFGKVFTKLSQEINDTKNENVFIVFFTDGCDGSTVAVRQAAMKSLKSSIETRTSGAALHTIGFTSSHDARLLSDITSIGTTQGTFQYVADSSKIKEAIVSLVSLLSVKNNVTAKLTIKSKAQDKIEKKIFFNESAPSTFASTTFVASGLLEKDTQLVLTVSHGDGSTDFIINHQLDREEQSTSKDIEYTTTYITDSLMQLSQSLFGQQVPPKEDLLRAQNVVKGYDKQIQDLFDQVMKMKLRQQKKTLMPVIEEVTAHLAEFHRALASGMANQLTNETIAKLNSLAYKKITKRSLAKRLDQRVEDNTVLFEKLEGFIEKAVANLNEKDLKTKYSDESIQAVGQCMLSCKNWVDAVLDSDCLCIAINVTRSEAAIADPTQVIVHSISPTFLSADSFLDSVEYALTKTQSSQEETHGGFNKQATTPSVIVGQAREAISAVLPLYISEEHWSVAKHKMKPVLGWVTTLDVLGYTSSQSKAIPFLAMATAAREAFSESGTAFHMTQYQLIFQTCKQIMSDFSQPNSEFNLAKDISEIYNKYHPAK